MTPSRFIRVAGVATLVCALSASCKDPCIECPPLELTREHDSRVFNVSSGQAAFTALPGATAFHGTRPGLQGESSYRIEVPDAWNGVLVMWAHGYRGTSNVLTVDSPPAALRKHLVDQGYAWAASSYSANYYDVRAGIEDTNALALGFASITGRPAPTKYYIAGGSMGGHVAAAAVERETLQQARSRVDYAAAFPQCGTVADNELANHFYAFGIAARGLAGIPVTSFPMGDAFTTTLPAIKRALWVDYDIDKFALTPQGEKFKHMFAAISGGPRPTFEETFPLYLELMFERAAVDGTWRGILSGVSANTTEIVYQLDADPGQSPEEAAFNASIFRVQKDFLAVNPLRKDGVRWMPIVEGRFDVPVLTLNTLETRGPFRMVQIYRERAIAHGNGNRLVHRAIRSGVHCDFTAEELTSAFDALVDWEVGGIVPAGDEVLDPVAVADPDYGCQFTTATRSGIPAC